MKTNKMKSEAKTGKRGPSPEDSRRPTQQASQGGSQVIQASQAQAESADQAGQAAGQPGERGEPNPGGASPATESRIEPQFHYKSLMRHKQSTGTIR